MARRLTPGSTGAAHVTTLAGSETHIREDLLMATTEVTFDFSLTPIRSAVIYLVPIATVTGEHISAMVCVDPPSDLVRNTWLTGADSFSADSNRIPVTMFTPALELSFTSPISYIGAKIDIGTTDECRMIVVGAA